MKRPMVKKLLLAIIVFALTSPSAFAYLDPGTGSLIIQGTLAAIAAIGVTLKFYWYKIAAFFGKAPPPSLLEDEESKD